MQIELEQVSFSYQKGTPLAVKAVSNVTLSVAQGEFIGLIGPTGAGKSTLVQLLNGLLLPDDGRVLVDGIEASLPKLPFLHLRRRIGLVFQFPENQLFEATVFDDVAYGPRNFGLSEDMVRARVEEAMVKVGLDFETFKDRSPFTLSGGEMRRAAIAGVLASKPEVVIFDEPTSGLDAEGKQEILSYLAGLHRKEDLTVVLISHDMDEVAEVAERVVVLVQGEIVLDGAAQEVFSHTERFKHLSLEIPQAAQLILALKKKGCDVPFALTVEAASKAIIEALKSGSLSGRRER